MKPRLLLLSDLFGGKNPEWISYYKAILEAKFEIQYYDVLQLANIKSEENEANIHNQFLNGGIDNAIRNLLDHEREEVAVLGFSIGGTIAWKAALQGLNISQLIAVSSTRLRFETQLPNCTIKLYFGENDVNKPRAEWFSDFEISKQIFKNEEHNLYLKKENVVVICNEILKGLC